MKTRHTLNRSEPPEPRKARSVPHSWRSLVGILGLLLTLPAWAQISYTQTWNTAGNLGGWTFSSGGVDATGTPCEGANGARRNFGVSLSTVTWTLTSPNLAPPLGNSGQPVTVTFRFKRTGSGQFNFMRSAWSTNNSTWTNVNQTVSNQSCNTYTMTFTPTPGLPVYIRLEASRNAAFTSVDYLFDNVSVTQAAPVCPAATATVVENCAGGSYSVQFNVTSIGSGGSLTYALNGVPQTPLSIPTTGAYTVGPIPTTQTLTFSLSNALSGTLCNELEGSAWSSCPVEVVCGSTLTVLHCYGNNDTRSFTYIAPPGETITLTFIQGTMAPGDVIRAYSGTSNMGTPILELTGNFPLLPPASGASLGNELFLEIESTASNSCADGQQTSWEFEVKCTPACQSPDGAVMVNTNCAALNYTLDVEVFFTGDGSTTTLWYSVDGGLPQTVPGMVEMDMETIGPFPLSSTVNVRLLHETQSSCDRNLGNFTRDQICPPANDLCGAATTLTVNTPAQCPAQATAGTTFDAGSEVAAPGCDGTGTIRDVWYRFNSGFNQSPILISIVPGTIGHWGMEIYTGCGGTLVGCVPGSPAGVNLTNAAAYTDYWVRVFTNTSLGAQGSFNICVSATPQATSCGSVIRDPGGTSNYGNNANVTTTYCPANPGEVLTMTFTEFDTEEGYDFVRIYNGPSTASPLLGIFSGTAIPGPFTSTHPSGCLTVNFTSDVSFTYAGYTASLTCCVAPAPTLNLTSNSPVCAGNDLQLNCNAGTVFSWSGPGGFTSNVQNPVRTNVAVTHSGTYSVTARNGANGCPTTASVNVVVNPTPTPVNIVPATPAPICAGSPVGLSASGGMVTGPVISGTGTLVTTGSTTTAALGPNPMQNYYGGTKQQMLWRASELAALGFANGTQLSALAIDLATANTGYALNNFRIKYQWTSAVNALTTTPVSTGWTNILPAQTVTPQVGYNTFTFSGPITWNGTDNLLIEINYSNNNTGTTATQNTARYFTGLTYNATNFHRADNVTAGTINGYTMTMNQVYAGRNNVRFMASVAGAITWTPGAGLNTTSGAAVVASPNSTTTYTATAASPAGCTSSSTVDVIVNPLPTVTCGGPYGPLCVNTGTVTLSGDPAGGTWSGPGVSGNVFDPAVAAAGSHVLTYNFTDGNGCTSSCTTTIVVNGVPNVTAGAYGPYCSVDLPVSLGGTPNGGIWSGNGVSGNSFDPSSGTSALTYTYTDGNGCTNSSQTSITVDTATPWYADQDGDGTGDAATSTMGCTQPSGYVANDEDTCPVLFGQNGDACDAGPGFVLGTIVNCACVGQQCTTDLVLEFQTDSNGPQNTWELRTMGTNILVQNGGGWYPGSAVITDNTCLPDGCYYLRVFDAGGDGMVNGGYILRTTTGQRVIDNRNNFTSGSMSAVIGNGGFCLPLGSDRLIFTSCDKLDWVNDQYIVAAPNPAVSAQWGVGDQTDDGYQFWWFDPNGNFGYSKFRSHATSDGFGPANAVRACHARINNWSPNQIPANMLMNVKVRSRVNGANSNWGPVCRFKIDPVTAACPLTKLMDIPGNQFYSCGVTRTWGGSNRVHARPVDGATQYQFRFNNGELAAPVIRTVTTYYLNLNWTPALPNGTYQVQVRAFKNGAWCVTSLPWGDECNVTIVGSTAMTQNGDGTVSTGDAKLAMFPNPNRGDLLTLSLSAVEEGVNTVSVDIFDLTGAVVSSRTIAVNDGMVYQVLELNEMASGLYMVNITAGSSATPSDWVIAK